MLLSWNWLNEFVELSCTPQEAAEALTVSGSEIESLRRADEGVFGIVIGKIVEFAQHPTKSGLKVTRVDVGDGSPRLVVTAAKNVKLGDVVAYAISGSKVKSGLTLGLRDFDGYVSDGMMASAAEMGVPDLVAEPGILILPDDAPLGADALKYLGLDDWILELSITPNRGDLLSYLGVARELCALFEDARLKPLSLQPVGSDAPLPDDLAEPRLDTSLCRRYDLGYVTDVKPDGTPLTEKVKLVLSGMRPINPVVDATNLTMLALGQPLHAFDADKLDGRISVRLAREGQYFETLDGKMRELKAYDLMIYSGETPVGLAGVMGGANTSTESYTKRVVVESASFDAPSIMRTSRRLGLNSEASYRMARGVDPLVLEPALCYFTALLERWGCGKAYKIRRTAERVPYQARHVSLNPEKLSALTGRPDWKDKVRSRLTALGLREENSRWLIPSWRLDLNIEEDLIEEVARLEGYNDGVGTIPPLHEPGEFPDHWKRWRTLRDGAVARGYVEAVTFSFLSPELLHRMDYADESKTMVLANPLSADLSTLRPLILPSLLAAAENAVKRGWRKNLRLFEMGRVFVPEGDQIVEYDHICGLTCAALDSRTPYGNSDAVDFFSVKADLEALLLLCGVRARFKQAVLPWAHRGQCAEVLINGRSVGWLARVKPLVEERFDLKTPAFYFELNVESLIEIPMPHFRTPGEYPPAYRDVALLVPQHEVCGDLEKQILKLGAPLARQVRLFDVYRGEGVPADKKSLAFSVCYQRDDRTLTDEEIEGCHQTVRRGLAEAGYELR